MGRGNVCTFGKYEGLYYIDNDHIHVYRDIDAADADCIVQFALFGEVVFG